MDNNIEHEKTSVHSHDAHWGWRSLGI